MHESFCDLSDVMSVEVLDVPALQDDFYLNLVDWSTQNVLAVGLGNCVYLWNGCSSKIKISVTNIWSIRKIAKAFDNIIDAKRTLREIKLLCQASNHKAAESRLLEIKERKERLGRSTKAATLSTPVGSGEEEEEDITDDDSEEERDAIDLMEMLNRVSAIKEQQLKNGEDEFSRDALDDRIKKAETWHRDAAARVLYSRPAQPITFASVSQGHEHKHQPMIFGLASIVNGGLSSEIERMIAQVFQPSHRMPTMSIEDAGLTEMNIVNDWQEQTKKAIEEATTSWYNDKPLRRKEEDENDDEDEEAVMKARAFDDWKDGNPRGAGNKKLTPCS
ncbi:unnamed protein product [Brassica oleracea]